jgi:hypothetical protein
MNDKLKLTIVAIFLTLTIQAQVFEPIPFDKKWHIGAGAIAGAIYSYMHPWSYNIFNKWVSDYKEELTLPTPTNQTNVSNGTNRKNMLVYNDTAEGTYENIALLINIPNPSVTNRASELTSYLYNFGTTYGKLYLYAGQNVVLTVGSSYTTEINVRCGYIEGLISWVDTYVGA